MARLIRDGEVLADVEIAASRRARRRGLLGRDGIEGALLLEPGRSVHSFGMRFAIDVAFCDRDRRVIKTRTLRQRRITAPVLAARSVIEAEAGAFEKWRLGIGDQLEIEADP